MYHHRNFLYSMQLLLFCSILTRSHLNWELLLIQWWILWLIIIRLEISRILQCRLRRRKRGKYLSQLCYSTHCIFVYSALHETALEILLHLWEHLPHVCSLLNSVALSNRCRDVFYGYAPGLADMMEIMRREVDELAPSDLRAITRAFVAADITR